MDEQSLAALLEPIKEIARAAGRAILAASADGADVTTKQDGSPLTRADTASHEVIESRLLALKPVFPIVSEEGDLRRAGQGASESYWLVDPLDGTKEFVKGLSEYTVNIALVERGAPILGVIYAPAVGALYCAAKGLGAWKVGARGSPRRISAKVRRRPRVAVVSRSHLSAETEAFLSRQKITEVIKRGSSLKMCAVAEGQADVYPRFGPTYLWDTAAGAAIATEAGCVVVDLAGEPLRYDLAAGLKHAGFIVRPAGLRLSIDPERP
jgi:3'(2'), 5'-bisphosphate nucleotidase